MRFFKINLILIGNTDSVQFQPMIIEFCPWSNILAQDRRLWPTIEHFGQWSSSFAHDRQLSHMIVHSMIDHFGSWSNRMIIDHTLWPMIVHFGPWSFTLNYDLTLMILDIKKFSFWNWNFALGKSQMTDLEVTDSVFDIYMYANRPSHSWNWHLKIFI